jgi:hypothetical protein
VLASLPNDYVKAQTRADYNIIQVFLHVPGNNAAIPEVNGSVIKVDLLPS